MSGRKGPGQRIEAEARACVAPARRRRVEEGRRGCECHTSEDMNKSTRENDGKYCEWVTRDTRNKIVVKAAMVSLIISHDGAVHRVTVISLNDYSPYQGPSGADDTERAQVHCCDRREVLQQRQLGVRCIEEGTP